MVVPTYHLTMGVFIFAGWLFSPAGFFAKVASTVLAIFVSIFLMALSRAIFNLAFSADRDAEAAHLRSALFGPEREAELLEERSDPNSASAALVSQFLQHLGEIQLMMTAKPKSAKAVQAELN